MRNPRIHMVLIGIGTGLSAGFLSIISVVLGCVLTVFAVAVTTVAARPRAGRLDHVLPPTLIALGASWVGGLGTGLSLLSPRPLSRLETGDLIASDGVSLLVASSVTSFLTAPLIFWGAVLACLIVSVGVAVAWDLPEEDAGDTTRLPTLGSLLALAPFSVLSVASIAYSMEQLADSVLRKSPGSTVWLAEALLGVSATAGLGLVLGALAHASAKKTLSSRRGVRWMGWAALGFAFLNAIGLGGLSFLMTQPSLLISAGIGSLTALVATMYVRHVHDSYGYEARLTDVAAGAATMTCALGLLVWGAFTLSNVTTMGFVDAPVWDDMGGTFEVSAPPFNTRVAASYESTWRYSTYYGLIALFLMMLTGTVLHALEAWLTQDDAPSRPPPRPLPSASPSVDTDRDSVWSSPTQADGPESS